MKQIRVVYSQFVSIMEITMVMTNKIFIIHVYVSSFRKTQSKSVPRT